MSSRQSPDDFEEEKAIQGLNSALTNSCNITSSANTEPMDCEIPNNPTPAQQSIHQKLKEFQKQVAQWKKEEEEIERGERRPWSYEEAKEIGRRYGLELSDDEEATEEEIKAFDAMPKAPNPTFEEIRGFIECLPLGVVVTNVNDDGTRTYIIRK